MPTHEELEELKRLERSRTAGGALAPKPAPPAKAVPPPPVKFTKPFTEADRAKQAAAFQKALRKHEREEDEY